MSTILQSRKTVAYLHGLDLHLLWSPVEALDNNDVDNLSIVKAGFTELVTMGKVMSEAVLDPSQRT